jgi:ferrochelatase
MPIDAVLLIGFGGPTAPEEVRPFLENVVRDRRVPPARLEEVAHHYEEIGGRSPYNDLTFRQAEALRRVLAERGRPMPVYVGMRNWTPYFAETLARMREEGVTCATGVILAPHQTDASWERYQREIAAAREEIGDPSPVIDYLEPWFDRPGFLEAMAQRVEEATGYARGAWPPAVPLLFTAHSVPVEMAEQSPYVAQIRASGEGIARILGAARWEVVYQSRSGDPRQPWLEPDVNDVLRAAAADGVREMVLVPVGFLCDHVEVLFDLDVEARHTAETVGIRFHRAGTVGDHPAFIGMLADRIVGSR